jgi:hypothetical protein
MPYRPSYTCSLFWCFVVVMSSRVAEPKQAEDVKWTSSPHSSLRENESGHVGELGDRACCSCAPVTDVTRLTGRVSAGHKGQDHDHAVALYWVLG